MKRVNAACGLTLLLLFTTHCGGSTTVPAKKVGASMAAIRTAEQMGVQKDPGAAKHLKLARDELKRAEELMKDGDDDEAVRMLDRAEVDAQVAMALGRAESEREGANAARAKVQEMRSRIGS